MKRINVGIIFSFVLFLVLSIPGALPSRSADDALDGKTFVGDMGEKAKDRGDKDELVFKDGKFHSVACEQYGLGDATYTTTVNGDTTTFAAVTKSAEEGEMKWSGTVTGGKLNGTTT